MKILFVCRANIGRSQAAMAFYNLKYPGMANSAGTLVDNPNEQLKQRSGATNIILVMKEYGIDMSEYTRKQLEQPMFDGYNKIIVMAEPETIPKWLLKSDKMILWQVTDPKGQSIEETREIAATIKARVDSIDNN